MAANRRRRSKPTESAAADNAVKIEGADALETAADNGGSVTADIPAVTDDNPVIAGYTPLDNGDFTAAVRHAAAFGVTVTEFVNNQADYDGVTPAVRGAVIEALTHLRTIWLAADNLDQVAADNPKSYRAKVGGTKLLTDTLRKSLWYPYRDKARDGYSQTGQFVRTAQRLDNAAAEITTHAVTHSDNPLDAMRQSLAAAGYDEAAIEAIIANAPSNKGADATTDNADEGGE